MIIKEMKNGNVYYYYKSGKIKVITKKGDIKWYTKQIFYPHYNKKPKKKEK
ncbi:hypothetical protein [Candidatus Phytoplasma pruni]|uniref:Uncharacterized protein n=1 Tax=Candidatus Phytoplasma pruni TaxID=479893 RepID=A0A851HJ69_9MOLU|nr:hypothetical protein [Candidatus Phytoplasma pruni]NWN45873.1 hypothetical protein [Candidatus Phytoplasma pruni]